MPYKIYTYADPYRIKDADFWDGRFDHIKYYPQLCASRTLVNGLVSVMKDEITSLICPIDAIVSEKIFRSWTKDIGLKILQYSELSKIYRELNKQKYLSDTQLIGLLHNSDGMLDAIRLFVELGIESSSLNAKGLSLEHRLFAYLLKNLESNQLFTLPEMPSLDEISTLLTEQAEQEREEKEIIHAEKGDTAKGSYWEKESQRLDRMIKSSWDWDRRHIVIHGIHQFTPLQLRFIQHLDKLGVEVIFLHNYLPEFQEIYSSWSYIYQQFNTTVHHDENIKHYTPAGQIQKPGNAIAVNLGLLCDEAVPRIDERIRRNYELYKNIKVTEFDNISEYAGYISDKFQKAEENLDDGTPLGAKPFRGEAGTAAVLEKMDEVVYTANKDVDDLLQLYHPEYARNRHFLAYPVGQFFTALYAMWKPETQSLELDYNLLRECVNSGMLTKYRAEALLKTLMNVRPLFDHIKTMQDFFEIAGQKYINAYRLVQQSFQGASAFHLKAMNIYNAYKVTAADFDNLYSAILEIDQIAREIFAGTQNESFSFKKHFERLEEFIRKRQPALVTEEEKNLVAQLLQKLDQIHMSQNDNEGTFDDLRHGLYFFLKQKEEPRVDWFVKNFEQIDGDVLLSKSQNRLGVRKTYHFACVSDADMNKSADELLPWPLSEMFIDKAYNPKELPFQVYYAALGERSNFLRYELFYGLFFNQCDSKISFVKHCGDNITDVYRLLTFIGLQKADAASGEDSNTNRYGFADGAETNPVNTMPYNNEAMADMFLCPYRYFLDYVMNPQPIFSGRILFEKLYENLLVEKVWQRLQGKPLKMACRMLSQTISNESTILEEFFPFFRDTEILDLETRASNYLVNRVFIEDKYNVPKYKPNHMSIRKLFGKASFYEGGRDYSKSHPLEAFDKLAEKDKGQKIYKLHKIYGQQKPDLIKAALKYINEEPENMVHTGSWCELCACRGICLESFADKEN